MVGDEPYAPSVRLGPRKRATEELGAQIEQVAGKYRELVDLQSAGPLDKAAASAPVHVADVFIPVVLGIKDGQFITNAQTNPYASAEEAFRARLRTSRRPTAAMRRSSKRVSTKESAFHAGAMFYAFETQLILALRRRARMSRGDRCTS